MLEAAAADRDREQKVELLVSRGFPVDGVNSFRMSLLHLAAMASSLRIMELATPAYQISTNIRDSHCNTPLHYLNANEGKQANPENIARCVDFLLSRNANMINMVNCKGENPLVSALAASRKQVVRALLNAGAAIPSLKMTGSLTFKHVSVLAENDVIVESKRPVVTTLQVAGLMRKIGSSRPLEARWLEISNKLEKSAIAMVNSSDSSLTAMSEEVLLAAVENKQKQVIVK